MRDTVYNHYNCTISLANVFYCAGTLTILLASGGPQTLYEKYHRVFFSIAFASIYSFFSSSLSDFVMSWLSEMFSYFWSFSFRFLAFFKMAILKSGASLVTNIGLFGFSLLYLPSLIILPIFYRQ